MCGRCGRCRVTDCILHNQATKYGSSSIDGVKMGLHQIAYVKTYGPIPDGLWVLHHCHVPRCINPEHLYAGTPQRNNLDTVEVGHHVSANAAKITCPRGHEYDYVKTSGSRWCRTCQRKAVCESMRKARAR